MPEDNVKPPLVSHTGVALTRPVAFRFALDPTIDQAQLLSAHAGTARLVFNHHLARVKSNLGQRTAERTYDVPAAELTPALSWSKMSLINEMNAWKTGAAADSPTNDDGTRGLAWRAQVSADVFETASVDAATALKNFTDSRKGNRARAAAGFPRFKAKHHTTPAFRIRSKSTPGTTAPVRIAGPKSVRLGKLGEVRVHGCTRQVRRMLEGDRLHLYAATVKFERGRWWVSLQGVAAPFHAARRSAGGRHALPAGIDRGIKTLAVIADDQGAVLRTVGAVNSLKHAQETLRRANKAYSRTKIGSVGRRKAAQRLGHIHARVANLRTDTTHKETHWAATQLTRLTIEDLNVKGMFNLKSLRRALSDAGMGDFGRTLEYKAAWYGLEVVTASRWYPSSKTCSGCGHIKGDLTLADRTYRCTVCRLVLDRDVNAAVNLARWPDRHTAAPPLRAAA